MLSGLNLFRGTGRPQTTQGALEMLWEYGIPWFVASFIGFMTALTAAFISYNTDFIGDLRFGTCQGGPMWLSRSNCCGGAEHVHPSGDRCVAVPAENQVLAEGQEHFEKMEWVPWYKYFSEAGIAGVFFSGFWYVLTSVVLAATAALLVHKIAPEAKGSGIPEVKAGVSGFWIMKSFASKTYLVKALGLAMTVGAGLALGKEGPMVHMGSCLAIMIASSVAYHLTGGRLPLAGHDLLCVGAASGVSAAFGAPLGGVLFVVEELGSMRGQGISANTLLLSTLAAFSSAFTLKAINLTGTKTLTLFEVTYSRPWQTWEGGVFIVLGIVGGLVGAFFIRLNMWVMLKRRKAAKDGTTWFVPPRVSSWFTAKLPNWIVSRVWKNEDRMHPTMQTCFEIGCLALFTALLNYPFSNLLRLLAPEAIHALYQTCPHAASMNYGLCDPGEYQNFSTSWGVFVSLLFAACIRLLQMIVTFGARIPAGLFIPSLFIGACLGRLVGQVLFGLHVHFGMFRHVTDVEPGIYAMVGSAAVLAGVSRMTVSLVVIMFELTGGLNYVVPFSLAVISAKWVGDLFSDSIYECHAVLNGFCAIEPEIHERGVTTPIIEDIARKYEMPMLNPNEEYTLAQLLRDFGTKEDDRPDIENTPNRRNSPLEQN